MDINTIFNRLQSKEILLRPGTDFGLTAVTSVVFTAAYILILSSIIGAGKITKAIKHERRTEEELKKTLDALTRRLTAKGAVQTP